MTASRDGIGFASLTCDRGFRPLRWQFVKPKKKNQSGVMRLIDRTDAGTTTATFYSVEAPTVGSQLDPMEPVSIPPVGGLIVARAEAHELGVILPTDPNNRLREPIVRPEVPEPGRHPSDIRNLISIDYLWASAERPGDPFVEYDLERIHGSIARAIAMSLCGGHWAKLERRVRASNEPADLLDDMQGAVGDAPLQTQLARHVGMSLHKWDEPEALEAGFAKVVRWYTEKSGRQYSAPPRLLIALANEPWRLNERDQTEIDRFLDVTARAPFLLRLARFATMGTHAFREGGLVS